jgi:O-methyltransferase involved in polyketide biosynthesis
MSRCASNPCKRKTDTFTFEMPDTNAQIEHVSDTALMVAACRAIETERPDRLVRDPFAGRLAGERGMAIARASPILEWMCFGVGIRARFVDELLAQTLSHERIETVANLGAGLDTRPWRLDLDPDLRWLEADFREMLEYKAGRLAQVTPRCRLEQVPTDLASAEARRGLFERIGQAPALMITEGLLTYLPPAVLLALATEPPRFTGVRYWLLDTFSPDMMRMAAGNWKSPVEKLRPEDHLAGQAILDAVGQAGWTAVARRTYVREGVAAAAARVARLLERSKQAGASAGPGGQNQPGAPRPGPDDISGIYLFKHRAG